MRQTFEINTSQLSQLFDTIVTEFGRRRVKIVIEEIPGFDLAEQRELFERLEDLQREYPPILVGRDIDLSTLANDVNF